MKKNGIVLIIFFLIVGIFIGSGWFGKVNNSTTNDGINGSGLNIEENGSLGISHPLSIKSLRLNDYPASEIVIEETLASGSNYNRYLTSYKSEGLKIYALLTVPFGEKPQKGWPVIIFNHGYIPPKEYQTTERYIAYTNAFSANGYIVFKPDYRGHGNSQGQAAGGYGSNAYTIDVLNALASIKKLKNTSFWQAQRVQNLGKDAGQASMTNEKLADPNKIGMWGHSMGGFITLRAMVVSKDIKAGVIWGGVVASYSDLLNNWRRRTQTISPTPFSTTGRGWRQSLVEQYGEPEKNPVFWNSISANSFLSDISGPIQLHHGGVDSSVPPEFSKTLYDQLQKAGKEVELYTYPGDDHNISSNLFTALNRSVAFFDKYLKPIE